MKTMPHVEEALEFQRLTSCQISLAAHRSDRAQPGQALQGGDRHRHILACHCAGTVQVGGLLWISKSISTKSGLLACCSGVQG